MSCLSEYSWADEHPRPVSRPDWLKNSAIRMDGVISSSQIDLAAKVDLPEDLFGNAAKYLGVGLNYFEKDNSVRYQPLLVKYENRYYPSQELLAAAVYMGFKPSEITYKPGESILIGSKTIPVDTHGRFMINYLGKPGRFTSYSVKDLWDGKIPVEEIENKIIIVTLTATGQYDNLVTPVSKNMTPGEKSATIMQNIVKENYVYSFEASANMQIFILLGIGLFCAFILPRVILVHRFTILVVFLFILINLNFVLFSSFNTVTKTFYPALEIILFMLAAPMMKSDKDIKRQEKKKQVQKKARAEKLSDFQDTMVVSTKSENAETVAMHETPHPEPIRKKKSGPIEKAARDRADQETIELSAIDHSAINVDEPILDTAPQDQPESQPESADKQSDKIEISFDNSGRPKEFGRYKIIDTLGQGAMGTVYKGLDPAIDRPVALKTIRFDKLANPDEIEEMRKRFMLEAKAAGNFSHPHIVTIYDVGQDKNIQYIAMEYLEGQTLEELIKRKASMNFKIVAKIITQVCSALSYAHDRQVVHRDIKPANIMVMEGFAVKVMDFGIAHLESSNMTQTGVAMGTPNYISPEQLSGKEVTKSSDIFSLGVVMYELLTGQKPFEGENLSNLIMKILNQDPAPRPRWIIRLRLYWITWL